ITPELDQVINPLNETPRYIGRGRTRPPSRSNKGLPPTKGERPRMRSQACVCRTCPTRASKGQLESTAWCKAIRISRREGQAPFRELLRRPRSEVPPFSSGLFSDSWHT